MIKKFIKKFKNNKKFLLAYSGGIDSTALLRKMISWKKKKNIVIRAIHINHNISKKSKKWENHCKKICKKNFIPLIIKNIHIKKTNLGLEGESRLQRYKIYNQELLKNEILLIAHNKNDQCESFLLSLKRGSGLNGLSSMSYIQKIKNNILVRPLLFTDRKTIQLYIKKKNIKYINDPSNNNVNYERNFIRKKIIPIFQKKWKFFLKNCFKSIKILQQEKKIIQYYNNKIIKKYLLSKKKLILKKIKKLKKNIFISIIIQWIKKKIKNFYNYKLIKKIYYFLKKNDKKIYKFQITKKYNFTIYKNIAFIIKKKTFKIKNLIIFWNKPFKKIKLPYSLGTVQLTKKRLCKKSLKIFFKHFNFLNFRFHIKGKIFFLKNKKKKEIKKIWKIFNIDAIKKKKIPLLFQKNKFLGALNVFSAQKKKYCKNKNNYFYLKFKK